MSGKDKNMIELESSGGCNLIYSTYTSHWYTGNSVGEIDTLLVMGEAIPIENCEKILCLAINPLGNIIAVCQEKIISLYDENWNMKNSVFCRTTLPITHVEFDSTGQHLFVSCQDKDVRIYSIATASLETTVKSLDDPVKTFSVNHTGDYIAILNGKGDLIIYRLVSEKGPLGKSYLGSNLVSLSNGVLTKLESRNFEEGFHLSWRYQPDGSLLVCIPQSDGSPMIISRQINSDNNQSSETWSDSTTILTTDMYEQILSHCSKSTNLVSFSPNGKYLASVDISGKILIWDMSSKDVITSYQCHGADVSTNGLRDIQWGVREGDNYLMVLSQMGVAKIENVINLSLGHALPTGEYTDTPHLPVSNPKPSLTPTPSSTNIVSQKSRLKKSERRDEDDEDNLFDSAPVPSRSSALPIETAPSSGTLLAGTKLKGNVIADEDEIEGDDMGDEEDVDDTQEILDDMEQFLSKTPKHSKSLSLPSNQFIQNPFQPSATAYDEKRRRYMVWNGIGSITTRDDDIGNRIDIRFADTNGTNKNEYFNDNYGFELADLSSSGAIFATHPTEQLTEVGDNNDEDETFESRDEQKKGKKTGSVLFYKPFSTKLEYGSVPNETWTLTLQYREVALNVCAGVGWSAVVTVYRSTYYLRVITSCGIQLFVTLLKGSPVCICGYESSLGVVYNQSGATIDQPKVLVDLYNITTTTKISSQTFTPTPHVICLTSQLILPLTSKGSLQWISFSSTSQLAALDSNGLLSILFATHQPPYGHCQYNWVPILDTSPYRKTVDYHIYPVTIKGEKFCYVLLNGEKKPSITPQPIVTARPFKIPIIETKEKEISKEKDKDGISLTDRSREYLQQSLLLSHYQCLLEQSQSLGINSSSFVHSTDLGNEIEQMMIGLDKMLLKLYYEYMKRQRVAMALDTVNRMITTDAIESAIKIANHFSKPALAAILQEILEEKRESKRLESERDEISQSREEYTYPSSSFEPPRTHVRDDHEESDQYQYGQSSQTSAWNDTVRQEENHYDAPLTPERQTSTGSIFAKKQSNLFVAPSSSSSRPKSSTSSDSGTRPGVTPTNKFAQSQMHSPSKNKKRNLHESLAEDLKASPSPKKASLSRESSFSKEARSKRLYDKSYL